MSYNLQGPLNDAKKCEYDPPSPDQNFNNLNLPNPSSEMLKFSSVKYPDLTQILMNFCRESNIHCDTKDLVYFSMKPICSYVKILSIQNVVAIEIYYQALALNFPYPPVVACDEIKTTVLQHLKYS